MSLQLGFVIFWQKKIDTKLLIKKMLVKLLSQNNFTNIHSVPVIGTLFNRTFVIGTKFCPRYTRYPDKTCLVRITGT